LYVTVLDPAREDFKKSAQEFMDRADAVILHDRANHDRANHDRANDARANGGVTWSGVSLKPVAGRPVFRIAPPLYVTGEIVDFVRGFLAGAATADSLPNLRLGSE
jgi:hypothetical protein